MKPPKLYTSHPPSVRSTRRRRKRRSSPDSKAVFKLSEEKKSPSLSQRINDFRSLSQQLHSYALKMNQWLDAATNITQAVRDKDALNQVLKALSQVQTRKKKAVSTTTEDPSPSHAASKSQSTIEEPLKEDLDGLYQLLNSPSFPELVDKVMKNKKKRRF